ncbi:LysE family transport protein [Natronomonas moolapensis 8.8.11]|uniref:LysE family transport protein n=1 Tax=Natronomonas moolapensis (strain DSM 18674 / CECT 7526 / JCM 14361 / 8.8.11) TaxID=268739 RepID=M1XSU7_NATM8|nr:LysE family translocator [Natronomonas moolapensis]CCQ37461.1 LysE family transport protein [Natronomonas moolapensis 8.8.11]
MTLFETALAGVAFGLALAAPPGPMNAVIAEESVLRGWRAGFKTGLGAMTADVLFFLLALAGVATFIRGTPAVQDAMFLGGGALMLYFAYGAIRGARGSFRTEATPESRGFRKAFVLSVSNPYQILFWLTAGVGLLTPGTVDVLSYASASLSGLVVVETGSVALIVGLFCGVAGWIVCFPAALSAAESRTESFAPVVAYGSAVVLGGFGIYFLAEVVLP